MTTRDIAADYAVIRICHRIHNYSLHGEPTLADVAFRPELVRSCPDCGGIEWRPPGAECPRSDDDADA